MSKPPSEVERVSDKEKALVAAEKALDQRDAHAYRFFISHNQAPVALVASDQMFQLYLQGSSCEEIRRANPGFSLGQIVSCRVQHAWDLRREEYRRNLVTQVPARAQQVHLEQVDFLADLLTISRVSIQEKIRQAMASGKPEDLEEIPIPRSVKDLGALLDMFIRSTGQDKKRIEVSGNVTVDGKTGIASAVTPEIANQIMDGLLEDEVHDAEIVTPQKAPASVSTPKTPEEMTAFLVKTGVSPDKARALVESMGKEANEVAKRYSALVDELSKTKPEDVN